MSYTTTFHDIPQEVLGIILDYACTDNEHYENIILTCKLWKQLIEEYHTFKTNVLFDIYVQDFERALDVHLNSKRKYKRLCLNMCTRNVFTVEQVDAGTKLSKSTIKTVLLNCSWDSGFQMSFMDFKNLLNFKNLEILKITFAGTPFIRDTSFGTEIMELKNLKKLVIEFEFTVNDPEFRYLVGVKFLNYIQTPKLEDLGVNFKAFYPERNLPVVFDFLCKNSLHLKSVWISFLNTDSLFWSQNHLRINSYDLESVPTNFLAVKIEPLEEFHLLNLYDLNFLKMVLGGGHKIKKFQTNIDLMHLLDDTSYPQIKALTLMRSHFEIESLFKLSQNFPNVEDLCFCFSTLDQGLKEELLQIFPKLKNVSYDGLL